VCVDDGIIVDSSVSTEEVADMRDSLELDTKDTDVDAVVDCVDIDELDA
jgi:hypothetical protein